MLIISTEIDNNKVKQKVHVNITYFALRKSRSHALKFVYFKIRGITKNLTATNEGKVVYILQRGFGSTKIPLERTSP
jgi:hypothetical protein